MPTSFNISGFHNKSKKVKSHSSATNNIHRCIFQNEGRSDFSNGRKGFKGQRSNRQFLTKTSHCKIFSPSPGSDGFLHRTCSQCLSSHETNSVASSEFLEAFQRFSRNEVPCTLHLLGHLKWWCLPANILKGRSLRQVQTTVTITTDASKSMYGGHMGNS